MNTATHNDLLTIAGKQYQSRLLVGSGKYKDLPQTREATDAAEAQIITVAIRRVNIGQDPNAPSLLDVVPRKAWPGQVLQVQDQVEIVRAIGGG